MKYPIYSYKDRKVGFMPPQCDNSDETAIRGFSYAMNTKDGIMAFAPEDYELYRVGEFDTESATISPCVPVFLVSGTDVYGVK